MFGEAPGIFWHGSWVNPGTLGLGKMENVDIYLAPAIIWLPPRMSPACSLPHLPSLENVVLD